MLDIDNNTEPNLRRLTNLYSFLVIYIYQDNLMTTSPDYLIEKWQHWIGKDVELKQNVLQPGDIIKFADYRKTWSLNTDEEILLVKEIFYFIYSIEEIDLRNIIYLFRYFGGDLMKISSEKKTGLHPLTHQRVQKWMNNDVEIIKIFLRDMKIDSLDL